MLHNWSNFIVLGQLATVLNPICDEPIKTWSLSTVSEIGLGLVDYCLVWVVWQVMKRRPDLMSPGIGWRCSLWLAIGGTLHLWTVEAQQISGDGWIAIGKALEAIIAGLILLELLAALPKILKLPNFQEIAALHQSFWQKIQDYQQVQQALQETNDRLQTVINHVPVVLYAIDAQGYFTLSEGKGLARLGLQPGEVVGENLFDRYRDNPSILNAIRRALAGEAGQCYTQQGSQVYSDYLTPLWDEQGQVAGVIGVATDITEQHQAEQGLRRSEKLYRTLAQNFPNGAVLLFDHQLRYSLAEGQGLPEAGLSKEMLEGKTIWEVFPPDLTPDIEASYRQALAGIANSQELIYGDRCYLSHTLPIRDYQGVVTAGMVMTQDITERKRFELALQESETRFRTLCESMPCVAVQGYDHQRRVIFWNSASEALYGYSQAEALGQPIEDLIIPPQMREWAIATIDAWMKGGAAVPAGEMTVCRKDGSWIQVFSSHQRLTDAHGQPAMYCMDIDLSDRQQAKLAQQRLTNILEATADLVAMLDDQGQVSYLNSAGRKMLGLTPEDDLSNLPLSQFLLPVAIPSALEQGTWQGELELCHQPDDRLIISVALIAHRTPNGQLDYLSLMARDISAQKQVEKDLQENQKFLRLVIDNIPQTLFWKDRDSRFLGGNRQFVQDAGVNSIEEILGKTDYDFAWREQAPLYQADDRLVMQSNQPKLNIEEPITKPGGVKGWLRTNKIPLHDIQGNVVGVLGTYEDISERKRAELTLQNLVSGTASVTGKDFFPVLVRHLSLALAVRYAVVLERVEDQLKSLALYGDGQLQPNLSLSLAEAHSCRISMEQGQYQCFENIRQVFPEFGLFKQLGAESYLGIALKDATGQSIGNLCIIHDHPLKPSAQTEAILQIFAARAAAELERKRASEALRQLNIELEDRIHQRTIELAQINQQLQAEISDRIQAEVALRESEEKFRQLAENIDSVFWMVDLERPQDVYYLSSSYEKIWGRPCQAVYQKSKAWFESIHIEDQPRIAEAGAMEKQIRGEYDEEYRILRPDGEIRWIRDRAFPITNRQGTVYRLAGIAEDITQRKQAELEIIRNQDLREAIFNESADAIFLVDPETLLTIDCNRRAVEMFEANCKEDLLGIEGRILQRNPFSHDELMEINQEINTQAMWSRELEYRTFQGKTFWGNLAVKRISVAGRTLNLTRVTDISDRQEAEQKIRNSLQEKEVLLKEIHHRVKNNLYIISSLLKLQTRNLKDAKALEIFKDSQNRVHSMALIHEKLYQSKDLANINFAEYVQNLATDIFRSYGTNPRLIQLQVDVSDILFSVDIAIPCGLIINELLSNSLKYAFNSQNSGYILIQLQQNSQQDYRLMVKDNGIGFPPDLDFQQTPSLGLRLVCNLTEQLEGTITLIRDEGTCFCITFPRNHRG